jgi:enamine deaminase RidA (YjgF/YER057c/UK114 family)
VDPRSLERFVCGRPDPGAGDFAAAARSAWADLFTAVAVEGLAPDDVTLERVFLSDIAAQLEPVRHARAAAYHEAGLALPLASFVEQPPATPGRPLEILAHAVRNAGGRAATKRLAGLPAGAEGASIRCAGARRLVLCGLTGGEPGDGLPFAAQAARLFARSGTCLGREGMTFRQVARTWLFLTHIDRDYSDLNAARRAYFEAAGVHPPPASTGIGGRAHPGDRQLSLDLVAFDGAISGRPLSTAAMNEAPSYGSDFSRGFEVRLQDRRLVFVSGTASIDATGQVAHTGDAAAQARRMLDNVGRLLESAGATPRDLVHAVTYLKDAADRIALDAALAASSFDPGLPHVVCRAEVCRPDWRCEMEGLAVLPPGGPG